MSNLGPTPPPPPPGPPPAPGAPPPPGGSGPAVAAKVEIKLPNEFAVKKAELEASTSQLVQELKANKIEAGNAKKQLALIAKDFKEQFQAEAPFLADANGIARHFNELSIVEMQIPLFECEKTLSNIQLNSFGSFLDNLLEKIDKSIDPSVENSIQSRFIIESSQLNKKIKNLQTLIAGDKDSKLFGQHDEETSRTISQLLNQSESEEEKLKVRLKALTDLNQNWNKESIKCVSALKTIKMKDASALRAYFADLNKVLNEAEKQVKALTPKALVQGIVEELNDVVTLEPKYDAVVGRLYLQPLHTFLISDPNAAPETPDADQVQETYSTKLIQTESPGESDPSAKKQAGGEKMPPLAYYAIACGLLTRSPGAKFIPLKPLSNTDVNLSKEGALRNLLKRHHPDLVAEDVDTLIKQLLKEVALKNTKRQSFDEEDDDLSLLTTNSSSGLKKATPKIRNNESDAAANAPKLRKTPSPTLAEQGATGERNPSADFRAGLKKASVASTSAFVPTVNEALTPALRAVEKRTQKAELQGALNQKAISEANTLPVLDADEVASTVGALIEQASKTDFSSQDRADLEQALAAIKKIVGKGTIAPQYQAILDVTEKASTQIGQLEQQKEALVQEKQALAEKVEELDSPQAYLTKEPNGDGLLKAFQQYKRTHANKAPSETEAMQIIKDAKITGAKFIELRREIPSALKKI